MLQDQKSSSPEQGLTGMECWISGIRAEQSENRNKMEWLEYDERKGFLDFIPSSTGQWTK